MNILAVESSCDDTSVAIVRDGRQVLANCTASQIDIHKLYGGVVPEIASRKHMEAIWVLADEALAQAGLTRAQLDAVAVTNAPGLIGSLLVGVNFAKAVALTLNIPLIGVHHLRGHIAANYLAFPQLEPPFLSLVVSGGHTQFIHVKDYTDMKIIGSTLDDAAGECFDKVARVLGMDYPGGVSIDRLSLPDIPHKYTFPKDSAGENPLDMSFSGLKTAAINLLHHAEQVGEQIDVPAFCTDFSAAISLRLATRLKLAHGLTGLDRFVMAGGVAANSRIRADLDRVAAEEGICVYMPPLSLCGDNAAMIGAQAYYEFVAGNTSDMSLNAYASKAIKER